NHLLKNATIRSLSQQSHDVFDRIAVQDAKELLVVLDDIRRHQLVNLFALLLWAKCALIGKAGERDFRNVAKRTMPDIVEQRGELDQSKVLPFNSQMMGHLPRDVGHAQRMLKPSVKCSRIDKVRHCQLANSSQPLKHSCVQ